MSVATATAARCRPGRRRVASGPPCAALCIARWCSRGIARRTRCPRVPRVPECDASYGARSDASRRHHAAPGHLEREELTATRASGARRPAASAGRRGARSVHPAQGLGGLGGPSSGGRRARVSAPEPRAPVHAADRPCHDRRCAWVALTHPLVAARVPLPLMRRRPSSGNGRVGPSGLARPQRAWHLHREARARPLLENGRARAKSQCGRLGGVCLIVPTVKNTVAPRLRSKRRQSDAESNPIGSLISREACFPRGLDGEFDPGSGRTLAACLIHASRTRSNRWQHW